MIYDQDLEYCFLRTLMIFPELVEGAERVQIESAFYWDSTRQIYQAIRELAATDPDLLEMRLRKKIPERNFLDLTDHPALNFYGGYAQGIATLKDLESRRLAVAKTENLRHRLCDISYPMEESIKDAEELALTLAHLDAGSDRKWHGKNGTFMDLAEYLDSPTDRTIKTGLYEFDRMVSLRPGTLNLMIARPGMGKTLIGIHIADHVSLIEQTPTLYVSLEMSPEDLQLRRVSSHSQIDSIKFRDKTLNPQERERALKAWAAMNLAPLHYDGNPATTVSTIRSSLNRVIAKEGGVGLIVLDYLQLLSRETSVRANDLDVITANLRALTREFNIPCLCLAQINRANESRDNKRPTLADIRDSGAIEQHADTVTGIYREDYYRNEKKYDPSQAGQTELLVLKNRTGPTGTIKVLHVIEHGRYLNPIR